MIREAVFPRRGWPGEANESLGPALVVILGGFDQIETCPCARHFKTGLCDFPSVLWSLLFLFLEPVEHSLHQSSSDTGDEHGIFAAKGLLAPHAIDGTRRRCVFKTQPCLQRGEVKLVFLAAGLVFTLTEFAQWLPPPECAACLRDVPADPLRKNILVW